MREVTIKLYQYAELSDKAKEKAREWYQRVSAGDEWWDSIYEDAANVGIKITSFDCGRGESIEGYFTKGAGAVIAAILKDHGDQCESFKTATRYAASIPKAPEDDTDDSAPEWESYAEARDEWREGFKREILGDYLVILREELEHTYSEEYIVEQIEANSYEFTEDGNRADG